MLPPPMLTPLSSKRLRSNVVREEYIQAPPSSGQQCVRYVDVPVHEEVIVKVPHREIIEVERKVPKVEYQYVDRVVEVPEIEYKDRVVEIPRVEEKIKYLREKQIIDRPREVVVRVPVPEIKKIEKEVLVPGQVVRCPRYVPKPREVPVPHFIQDHVPLVVGQHLRPIVRHSDRQLEIDCVEYVPNIVEVEVPVATCVDIPLHPHGIREVRHRQVDVPSSHFNSMVKWLNPHLDEGMLELSEIYRSSNAHEIPLYAGELPRFSAPLPDYHRRRPIRLSDTHHYAKARRNATFTPGSLLSFSC